jgi:hypothetical protein
MYYRERDNKESINTGRDKRRGIIDRGINRERDHMEQN